MIYRFRRFAFLSFLFLFGFSISAFPDENPPSAPKVCLALSGGGARGAAHIGILKILEREGVPIDCIAGTSMGALAGGLYAAGYSPEEIEQFLDDQDWDNVFSDAPQWRFTPISERADSRYQGKIAFRGWNLEVPGGIWSGQRFTEALDVITSGPILRAQNNFDNLPTPFRAVATNLVDGKPYVFHQGSLTQAIRASISVPMMFTPLEIDNALLADGGLVNNLPVEVAREMGADIVIAIDVTSPLLEREKLRTLFDVVDQSISLQMERNVETSKKLANLVLRPNLEKYSNARYDKLPEIVKLGEEEAERRIDDIRALVAGIPARRTPPTAKPEPVTPIIESISFHGLNSIKISQVEPKIYLRPGQAADPVDIAADVSRIYATRLFESVSYTLEPVEENRYRLIFQVREDLLHTLGAGIRYDTDYDFTILLEFSARQLFRTPSRAVISAQLGGVTNLTSSVRYTPSWAELIFIEPKMEISRFERNDMANKDLLDTFKDNREGGQLTLGGTFFRQLELSAGYRIDRVHISGGVAPKAMRDSRMIAGLILRMKWDTQDSPQYPSSGKIVKLHIDQHEKALGGDFTYSKGQVDYLQHFPLSKKSTLHLNLNAGYMSGEIPFYDMFFVGGYSQSEKAAKHFPGFRVDEISASQMATMGLTYDRQIFTRPLSLLKRGYFTAACNTGYFSERVSSPYNFHNLNGLGIGMGLDTRIGPLHMMMGWGEGGRVNFYMSFGPSF